MTDSRKDRQEVRIKLLGEWDNKQYGRAIRIKGFESISQPFSYELELLTDNKQIMQHVLCNKSISFSVERNTPGGGKSIKEFNGIISSVNFLKFSGNRPYPETEYSYTIQVQPRLSNLMMIKNSKVYYGEKKTVVDVIVEILKEYKIDYELNIQNQKIFPAETYIQYEESTFNFISRLIQSAGLFYFFKHQKDKHVMIISNQPGAYYDLPNKKIEYSVSKIFSGIKDIMFNYAAYINDFTVNAFSYAQGGELIEKKYSNAIHQNQSKLDIESVESSYLGTIKDTSEIKKLTEDFGLREQALSEHISGESDYVELAVGGKFQLSGSHFDNISSKDYVLVKLDFLITSYLNDKEQYSNKFVAIPHDRYIVSNQTIQKPIITGMHVALVVNSEGKDSSETPYCTEDGRVFIKLLWNKNVTICKANILSTTNSFTLPRVGSLAYVLFPYNNLSHDTPVIVGIHNEGLMKFQTQEEWYKNIYMTYPASSNNELYNYIAFTDKKEEQEIKILARKDINFEIHNDETLIIQNQSKKTVKEGDITVTTEKGKITIQSEGPVHIETNSDLSLKASGNITLDSSKNINIKAMGDITLDAKGNISNKASLGSSYESGTTTTVKANVKVSIEGTVTEIKGKANINISAPLTKIGM